MEEEEEGVDNERWRRRDIVEMEQGCCGWGREYEGGGWSKIKDKIARMKCVEHDTNIWHSVINEYGIE